MARPKHSETELEETSAGPAESLRATIVGADGRRRAESQPLDRRFDPDRGPQRIGRYVVLRELGHGAMGVVLAAYHEDLDRKVAIKVLSRARQDRRDLELRLQREARSLAKLSHPNVVQVYDVGEHRGRVFVAMEFVEGETLREWMAREHDLDALVSLFIAIGRGLAAAHEAGVIHRDFKPENVIVGREGRPRVLDFGLARGVVHELDETEDPTLRSAAGFDDSFADEDVLLTQTGAQMGTPAYMSPEQHLGLPVGQGADQFGFCVALYEAICGQRPYAGQSVLALALATQAGEVRPPPAGVELPTWLHAIVLRGLSPQPEDRFPSMTALVDALAHGPPERHRRRWLQSAGFVTLALVSGILAIASEPPPSPCPSAIEIASTRWPGDPPAELRAQLETAQPTYAKTTAREVERRLRRWMARWAEQDHLACAATVIRHEFSTAVLDRRQACLSDLADQADALSERLARADPAALERGVEAVAALPDPGTCLGIERLLDADLAGTRDDQQDPELTRLQTRALVEPENSQWLPEARALVDRARAADKPWLEAQARLLLARNLQTGQAIEPARQELLDALDAAEISDNDALVLELATELGALEVEAEDRARLEIQARRLAAVHGRAPTRATASAHATLVLARAHLALDDLAAADAFAREALARYEAIEPSPPALADAHALLAHVSALRGLAGRAQRHRSAALDSAKTSLGEGHPRVQALEQALAEHP